MLPGLAPRNRNTAADLTVRPLALPLVDDPSRRRQAPTMALSNGAPSPIASSRAIREHFVIAASPVHKRCEFHLEPLVARPFAGHV